MALEHLNNENFAEAIAGEKPTLVDFFATWCGPCKMLTPIVEEIADEIADEISVYKLDIDEATETAEKYGIVAVPTLLLFKDGTVTGKLVGYREKEDLLNWIHESV